MTIEPEAELLFEAVPTMPRMRTKEPEAADALLAVPAKLTAINAPEAELLLAAVPANAITRAKVPDPILVFAAVPAIVRVNPCKLPLAELTFEAVPAITCAPKVPVALLLVEDVPAKVRSSVIDPDAVLELEAVPAS